MTVHVIGAGLAGLSAATALAADGQPVVVYDAARQAGGRCRSYFDAGLGLMIDNGNHFVAAGNRAVNAYLARTGAADRLAGDAEARFDFADVGTGARWALRPNAGRVPWWLLSPARRVPGSRARDYLRLAALLRASPDATLGDVVPTHGALWDNLLDTFFRSALNTPPERASARLAGAIVRETILAGGAAMRPRYAMPTLAAAFVDPALAYLAARGGVVRLATRVRAIDRSGGRATALRLGDDAVALGPDDRVIVATPPWVAVDLLPGLTAPDAFHAIVNAHFAVAPPPGVPTILAVLGGTAEWLVAHADRISVTVSAADDLAALDRAAIATRLWGDIQAAYRYAAPLPRYQIIKEARATFAATPEQDARRPGAATGDANLFLAGDWTQTGLPATIEGAIRSGYTAAGCCATIT